MFYSNQVKKKGEVEQWDFIKAVVWIFKTSHFHEDTNRSTMAAMLGANTRGRRVFFCFLFLLFIVGQSWTQREVHHLYCRRPEPVRQHTDSIPAAGLRFRAVPTYVIKPALNMWFPLHVRTVLPRNVDDTFIKTG